MVGSVLSDFLLEGWRLLAEIKIRVDTRILKGKDHNSCLWCDPGRRSDVKPEMHDITVLHNVVLAFQAHLAGFL